LIEYRYYRMRFNAEDPGPAGMPAIKPKPFQLTGPPVNITPSVKAGTNVVQSPYQVAATVTFRTPFPKHWGRIYLPTFSGTLTNFGRIGPTAQTNIANAAFDLQDDLQAAGFLVVVPMTQMAKQKFHGLLGVTKVVVDDIPDVIRRRRPKMAAIRQVGVE
jgi:hypothetical protein